MGENPLLLRNCSEIACGVPAGFHEVFLNSFSIQERNYMEL